MNELTPKMRLFCGVSTTLEDALAKVHVHKPVVVEKKPSSTKLKVDKRTTKSGRKHKFDYDALGPKVMELYKQGMSYAEIARQINVTYFAVVKMIRFQYENNS